MLGLGLALWLGFKSPAGLARVTCAPGRGASPRVRGNVRVRVGVSLRVRVRVGVRVGVRVRVRVRVGVRDRF